MNAQNIILFIIIIKIRCEEIQIGLPEYICDKDGGVKDISTDMTTIRLLGENQNVSYKFGVNFRTFGKKCTNNQRCTLLNWKSVRDLDRYLKNYPSNKLRSGLIEINNTMFTPGIEYILSIILSKSGKIFEEKLFTLGYADEVVRRKVKKPVASVVLLAPNTSYAYATYVVNAEVSLCSNVTSYYFKWGVNTTQLSTKNVELTLPPDTFRAHHTYTIQCGLVDAADGSVIANGQLDVAILSKGLLLHMPVRKIVTRINQPVYIKAIMKDLDNIDGDMQVTWTCQEMTNNIECDYQSDSTELEMESGFAHPGIYKISLEISKTDFTKSDFCMVEVAENTPIVYFDDIEYPLNPRKRIEIGTTVYDLKSVCSLQWTSSSEDGYEFLDLATVPGNVDAVVNATTKQDFLLRELEEFANDTVDLRYNLVLPPPSESWNGLKGDVRYLFRLVITCPEDTDYDDILDNSTSEIMIETNSPPETDALEVTPIQGVAFVTTFRFHTSRGKDKDGDAPFLYKFGYILQDHDIIVWKASEVGNCEVTLPYSKDGIRTFVETCDNFDTCGRILGPVVTTKLPQETDRNVILRRFVNKMSALDYERAMTEAFAVLHSYKDDGEGPMRDFISQKIEDEIEKYIKQEDKDGANELMKSINEFSFYLQLPETVLNKVLQLRNKLSSGYESERYKSRKLLSLRTKRGSYLSLSDVRNYLEISELLITTSNDSKKINLEKENLRRQLRNYMEKLCSSMKKPQLSLELKTLIFSVEKLKKNSLNAFISVPFEGNSWQTNARIKLGNVVKTSKDKCIGKAIFRDYLEKVGVIYFVDILNTTDINDFTDIVIYLPKNRSMEGTPDCLLYRNDVWNSDCKLVQSIANYVKCLCKSLGYYYLDYKAAPSTVLLSLSTPPTEKIDIYNQSLNNEHDKKNHDTISYIVIGVSIIGIVILAVTIRQLFHGDDDDDDDNENEDSDACDFPKYAQLHNEEFLTDAHI